MKYLDSTNLIGLSTYLDRLDCGDSILNGILESYSCKFAGSDKKLYKSLDKELETQYSSSLDAHHGSTSGSSVSSSTQHHLSNHLLQSASFSESNVNGGLSISPFGPLTSSAGRKTMIYLISTLNACFVDYDFSNTRPEQFRKESNLSMVMNSINTTLQSIMPTFKNELQERLWSSIDNEIALTKTDIYSFIPESPDPFTEAGVIWSFNYFFYNRTMKRIIFFSCRLLNKALEMSNNRERMTMSASDDEDDVLDYDNDDYSNAVVDDMELN
ncbi:hypothetical protein SAMD00019534_122170 [Acytostelium subglobosum LB1]|uniref:hypothetical protein n=1 Tax=Acytostelium subglobosum LB1 TaxID=1410327 RepID=UPI0006448B64|nr:hypothetical protein SAMD00019534_122170 [Acytostelium subglobosum LB1]GAM29041.1 hypothetical protein SAMD00019534_122170 [Acytostelium subglobosum LB1]|eukprot:XP_012748047.1 hypothetical protein SAMD00019534_122170 [Acytostelium subglobosum LB1]